MDLLDELLTDFGLGLSFGHLLGLLLSNPQRHCLRVCHVNPRRVVTKVFLRFSEELVTRSECLAVCVFVVLDMVDGLLLQVNKHFLALAFDVGQIRLNRPKQRVNSIQTGHSLQFHNFFSAASDFMLFN